MTPVRILISYLLELGSNLLPKAFSEVILVAVFLQNFFQSQDPPPAEQDRVPLAGFLE
jgi:hypothetical protein